MIIEKLKKEDISSYKELIDNVFDGSNPIEEYNKYDENNDVYEIIVAKKDDRVVGSITMYKINLFTYSFQPALEVFNVAVHIDYRGEGIAKKIFAYIFEYAKKEGFKQIFLTCLETAHGAHKLYESIGFVKAPSVKYVKDIK